jgi:hypothetical protein
MSSHLQAPWYKSTRKRKGGGEDEKFMHRFERIDQKGAGAMARNATLALELSVVSS